MTSTKDVKDTFVHGHPIALDIRDSTMALEIQDNPMALEVPCHPDQEMRWHCGAD